MKASVGTSKDLVAEGTHVVACVQIIDKGTKQGDNGDYRAFAYGLELTEEDVDDMGNPQLVFPMLAAQYDKEGNLKITAKSKLGKAHAAFLNKTMKPEDEVELSAALGRYAMATVEHKTVGDKTYANVVAIVSLPKGTKPARYRSELKSLFLTKEEFDQKVFDSLPDFVQTDIEGAKEYVALFNKGAAKSSNAKSTGKAPAKGKGKNDKVPF